MADQVDNVVRLVPACAATWRGTVSSDTMRTLSCALLGAGLLSVPAPSNGEEAAPHTSAGPPVDLSTIDKGQYTLWNPTPRQFLRDMEALYKSPYTVDAGHVQTETYLVGYVHDHDTANGADTRTEIWRIAPTTVKIGILNNLDLELEMAPYTHVRTLDHVTGTVTEQSGFGDLTPKAKLNLWGNDGGSTAVALLPFVKIPTSQDGLGNHAIEGGLALPMAIELPFGCWLGLSPELDALQDGDRHGYHTAFASTAYLWHEIAGKLSGYVEFSSWVSTERGSRWIGSVDFGLTYLLAKNVQLDAGVLAGVTRAAADVNPFVGVSFRF